MRSETLTRYHLMSVGTAEHMNVLLDRDNLKVGNEVVLVDDDTRWMVISKFETVERKSINQGWNNNI